MKALFLGLDHTLIRPLEGRIFPKDEHDWEFMPGMMEAITPYLDSDHKIIIVSNQGGIELGYQTKKEVAEKIQKVIFDMLWNIKAHDHELSRSCATFYFCSTNDKAHPDRKPNPGMIQRAMVDHKLVLADCLMVGDMETDQQAAQAAGVPFHYVNSFLTQRLPPFTFDEAWNYLKELADAHNNSDYARVKQLARANMARLTGQHFEIILDATLLTQDSVDAERLFLLELMQEMDDKDVSNLMGFRSGYSYAILGGYLDGQKDA